MAGLLYDIQFVAGEGVVGLGCYNNVIVGVFEEVNVVEETFILAVIVVDGLSEEYTVPESPWVEWFELECLLEEWFGWFHVDNTFPSLVILIAELKDILSSGYILNRLSTSDFWRIYS